MLKKMQQSAHKKYMYWFLKPVLAEEAPAYAAMISRPVDHETMGVRLERGEYETFGDFAADVRLMWTNALNFNSKLRAMHPANPKYVPRLVCEAAERMAPIADEWLEEAAVDVAARAGRETLERVNLAPQAGAPRRAGERAPAPAAAAQAKREAQVEAKRREETERRAPARRARDRRRRRRVGRRRGARRRRRAAQAARGRAPRARRAAEQRLADAVARHVWAEAAAPPSSCCAAAPSATTADAHADARANAPMVAPPAAATPSAPATADTRSGEGGGGGAPVRFGLKRAIDGAGGRAAVAAAFARAANDDDDGSVDARRASAAATAPSGRPSLAAANGGDAELRKRTPRAFDTPSAEGLPVRTLTPRRKADGSPATPLGEGAGEAALALSPLAPGAWCSLGGALGDSGPAAEARVDVREPTCAAAAVLLELVGLARLGTADGLALVHARVRAAAALPAGAGAGGGRGSRAAAAAATARARRVLVRGVACAPPPHATELAWLAETAPRVARASSALAGARADGGARLAAVGGSGARAAALRALAADEVVSALIERRRSPPAATAPRVTLRVRRGGGCVRRRRRERERRGTRYRPRAARPDRARARRPRGRPPRARRGDRGRRARAGGRVRCAGLTLTGAHPGDADAADHSAAETPADLRKPR